MSRLLSLILVLCCSISLGAEPQLPVLIVSESGYAWMIQDENGKPVLYEFSQVIVLSKAPPKPPVTPPVNSEFGLEAQAKQWMLTVTTEAKSNSKEISQVLSDTAKAAKEGKFNNIGEMEAALGAALSASIKDKKAWGAFGSSLQTAVSTFKKAKMIVTPDDFARALLEVVRGM